MDDTVQMIILDAEAGQLSAELACRGIAAGARVHVLVEVMDSGADALPMAAIAQPGAPATGSPMNPTSTPTPTC